MVLEEFEFEGFPVHQYQTAFAEHFAKHQEVSRAGQGRKFGGHGLLLTPANFGRPTSPSLKVTRLHTATHLLQAALRRVLGDHVLQKGSDITAERLRFDFTHAEKLTTEQIKEVETILSKVVADDLPIQFVELPFEEAKTTGALFLPHVRYPDKVKVYFAGRDLELAFSKEFCGGPHVTHTGEVGQFKILKDESLSAGVRRLRAVVE